MQKSRTLLSIIPLFILLAFTTIIETGCGGGGDDTTLSNNLASTSLVLLSADPTLQVGHPVNVEVGVSAERAVEDVTVDFYIVDLEEYNTPPVDDNVAVPMTYFHVGAAVLGHLNAGNNTQTVELVIPYNKEEILITKDIDDNDVFTEVINDFPMIPNRDYYLFAEIDPAKLITETNEDDNRPTEQNKHNTMIIVTVDDSYANTPNLILEKIEVEIPAIEMMTVAKEIEVDSCGQVVLPEKQNVDNANLGVTAYINSTGRYWPDYPNGAPLPIPRVEVRAVIKAPALGLPSFPISIWDSNINDYRDTLTILNIEPEVPMSVQLDFRLSAEDLPADIVDQVIAAMRGKASDCLLGCIDLVDAFCIYEELNSPSCDIQSFYDCGGDYSYWSGMTYPDWGCVLDRVGDECLDQCDLNASCMFDCAQELVDLEVTVTAFDAAGAQINGPPDFLIDNNFGAEFVMLPVPDTAPPVQTDPVLFETGFDKGFSAKLAYAGLKASAWAGLDNNGASTGLEAALPVVLFRSSPNKCSPGTRCLLDIDTRDIFLGVTSSLNATPDINRESFENFFNLEIYAFGTPIYAQPRTFLCNSGLEELAAWRLGGLTCTRDCPTSLPIEHVDYAKRELERAVCLRECGAFGKSLKIEKDFVVGVVPLTSSFEAWGLIGAEVEMALSTMCTPADAGFGFNFHVGPWADLGTEVSAGVGNSSAFAVGVGGVLDPILRDTFFATVALQNLSLNALNGNVEGTLREDITNTLVGPAGNVFWYVGYPCIKICRKWGIPYPCDIKQCKAKNPIVSFKTFEKEDVLFCAEQPFNTQ